MAAGGKPGLGSAMSMMFGGGPEGKVAHTLELRLGSNQGPTSPPVRGDHIFEPPAKLGKSVPLPGPEPGKGQTQNDRQIRRASCRDRVCQVFENSVAGCTIKKKKK